MDASFTHTKSCKISLSKINSGKLRTTTVPIDSSVKRNMIPRVIQSGNGLFKTVPCVTLLISVPEYLKSNYR